MDLKNESDTLYIQFLLFEEDGSGGGFKRYDIKFDELGKKLAKLTNLPDPITIPCTFNSIGKFKAIKGVTVTEKKGFFTDVSEISYKDKKITQREHHVIPEISLVVIIGLGLMVIYKQLWNREEGQGEDKQASIRGRSKKSKKTRLKSKKRDKTSA